MTAFKRQYVPDGNTYDDPDLAAQVNAGATIYERDTWWMRLLRWLLCRPAPIQNHPTPVDKEMRVEA